MRLRRIRGHLLALTGISILILISLSQNLYAATAEPPILGRSWYWEDYKQQEVNGPTGTVTVETTNPFCPQAPGSLGDLSENACATGRLPVEIRAGNYEVQNKFAALSWDFILIPPGSQIQSFKVTFLEAKTGCWDEEGKQGTNPTECNNEQTSQFNAEDKTLQACLLDEFFGDGEARPLREAPKFTCSPTDPTAKRVEVKSKDPTKTGENADHTWTFDLTEFAQGWVDTPPEMAGIVLRAQQPKGDEPTDSNWRVVLAGPQFPDGITSELKYIPGKITGGGGFVDPGTSDPGTTFIPGTEGTAGTPAIPGTPGVPGSSTPLDANVPVDTNPDPSTTPVSATGDIEDQPTTTPAYVWLGLLAGLIGFSVVRSIVVESATGIRPDGVLAQIKALNPTGTTAAAGPQSGPLAAIGSGLSTVGGWFRSAGSAIGSRLPFGRKG
jgi:hypothetical protein